MMTFVSLFLAYFSFFTWIILCLAYVAILPACLCVDFVDTLWIHFNLHVYSFEYTLQFAAGLCCGLSCLAAGGTIGILGEVGVKSFGVKAVNGRKFYMSESATATTSEMDDGLGPSGGARGGPEAANKLYVGMLIMLIFSEALALYGLIVALILSQHNYTCG
jgi:F0F1-type ATP synthase membrane subunit c/vacuolar-type H+-ATPase subunit K